MKNKIKYILGCLAVMLSVALDAQTTTENHVVTKTYKVESIIPLTTDDPYQVSRTIQYIDGLGRIKQSVIVKGGTRIYGVNQSILSKDIVTHVEYDGFGRQAKEYLPYASGNTDGRYETDAKSDTHDYYVNTYASDFPGITNPLDANVFSEKFFDYSSLNRTIEQSAPGKDWGQGSGTVSGKLYSDGHTIKLEYDLNTNNEVRYFPVTVSVSNNTYTPSLGTSSYYGQGELTKSVTKDENWEENQSNLLDHTTEEFKNKNGQVVLKRTYDNNVAHDTYYVYDDYGNLTYVFPPKVDTSDGISTLEFSELSYQYVHDYRNRLVEKKIPGKGWEYIVYDKLDRPVLTQDAMRRKASNSLLDTNEWLFTKYDALGRVAYTGMTKNNSSRISIQNAANTGSYTQYETRTATQGATEYYTNTAIPGTIHEIRSVNYYDTYVDLPSGLIAPSTVYNQQVTTDTKGLATVSKVRVLGTNDWITTVTYYDEKARPIYVYAHNEYLGTTDIVESKLDFTGKVLETRSTHQRSGNNDVVTVDVFEYDHMDRLINQSQKVNDQVSERIVRNNYDDLGQLKSKLTGSGTAKGYTDVTSGLTVNDDLITKTTSDGWDDGLATSGSFQDDGYLEYIANQATYHMMIGLSNSNDNAHFNTIDYAIYNAGSGIKVYENGILKGSFGSYQTGDVFRIERIGSTIYYKRNGNIFYTSQTASSGSLLGDVSISSNGGKIRNLHIVDNNKGLQNVDYAYNVRGWLKNINEDAQSDNDLFNFTLRYNDPTTGTALYNGNIAQTSWNTLNTDNSIKTYTYSYDALNRITGATDNTGNYNLGNLSYDKNGNILTLQRQGHTDTNATLFGLMDDLSYSYDSGNKLISVDDSSGKTTGFKDVSGIDYTYDANGNLLTDNNKGISNISYNHLNLPSQVSFSNGGYITYKYDATGVKLRKDVEAASEDPISTYYAGNFIYEELEGENAQLQFFSHPEGYVKYDNGNFEYIYQYKDHLGNVRLSYSDDDENGIITLPSDKNGNPNEIIEESNYYPFGLKHKGYNDGVSSNGNSLGQKKGFQEQMLDDELDLNWYGFKYRNYDASLARFHNIDPLAEDFNYQSPYNFAENRVIEAFELEGLEAVFIHGTWGNPNHMTSSQLKQIGNIFGNTSQIKAQWSGDNTSKARLSAAREIAQLAIESNNGKEPITLVGHSHGGNVAIEAINILRNDHGFEGEINLVTLNTPNRQEHQLGENADANHFNIYAKGDLITRFGDLDSDMWIPESLLGPNQKFDGAYNIMYEDQLNSGPCSFSNHCGTANSNFNTWLPLLQRGSNMVDMLDGLNQQLLDDQYKWIKDYQNNYIGSAGPADKREKTPKDE